MGAQGGGLRLAFAVSITAQAGILKKIDVRRHLCNGEHYQRPGASWDWRGRRIALPAEDPKARARPSLRASRALV